MTKNDFDGFLLLKEKEQKDIPEIDWEAEKNKWLSYLDELYGLFEASLNDYKKSGKIRITYDEISITEENIGTYKAPKMIIEFAGEKITLRPVGTNLIGVKGRVDVTSKSGSAKIVLVDSRMKGMDDHIKIVLYDHGKASSHIEKETPKEAIILEWKFITLPSRLYLPVNEDTIYSVIMELSNG
jgi:hypothetical protein